MVTWRGVSKVLGTTQRGVVRKKMFNPSTGIKVMNRAPRPLGAAAYSKSLGQTKGEMVSKLP